MTLGVGQFCTKPGFVLVPEGAAGDQLLKALTETVSSTGSGVLLDHRMRDAFVAGVRERAALPGVDARSPRRRRRAHRLRRIPHRARRPAHRRGPHDALLEECFGPVTVIARYASVDEIAAVLARLPGTSPPPSRPPPTRPGTPTRARCSPPSPLLAGRDPRQRLADRRRRRPGPAPRRPLPGDHVRLHLGRRDGDRTPAAPGHVPVHSETLLPAELREDNPLGLPRRVDGRRA